MTLFKYCGVQLTFNRVVKDLIRRKLQISTMESCTGGQIASLITNVDGSSKVLSHAYVTYSNEGKIFNGVPSSTIDIYGVYSPETAMAMAQACMERAKSNIGVGVTGSLNTVDEANADSECGVVYYCVKMDCNGVEDMRTGDIRFQPGKERIEMKYEIAEKIALLISDMCLCYDERY